MEIEIHIIVEYITDATLEVALRGLHKGNEEKQTALKMNRMDDRRWDVLFKVDPLQCDEWHFRFRVVHDGTTVDEEVLWYEHVWKPLRAVRNEVVCRWNTFNDRAYRYSSAFSRCIFPADEKFRQAGVTDANVVLVLPDYLPPRGHRLCISGSPASLGRWQTEKALPLEQTAGNAWRVAFTSDVESSDFEYKYILVDEKGRVTWESGMNRRFHVADTHVCVQVEDLAPRLPEASPKVSGVMIPLFALRSHKSFGVGDFGDLKRFIDLAARSGMRVVQILPVNDTTRTGTWADSYPYNAISVFALHPIYADLSVLTEGLDQEFLDKAEAERKRLNALRLMDYEGAVKLKEDWMRRYFDAHREALLSDESLKKFEEENAGWLTAYSSFRVLQSHFRTSDFRTWGELSTFRADRVLSYIARLGLEGERRRYVWQQYLLDGQLRAAHLYARSRGVVLKGDIPIGVSRDSATAWLRPDYFNFDSQAGAPPDFFSEHGQNWGFPTYNWPRILADGGRWWAERLKKMAAYFDAYRIDHVLGFFRIWEIPYEMIFGTLGHFNPALPLDKEEIKGFGFEDEVEKYVTPNFDDAELNKLFGEGYGTSQIRFFEPAGSGRWRLKKTYLSQRQILDETLDGRVRQVLMNCVADVLFIPDRKEPHKFHPNIMASRTLAYRRLSESDREAYDRLSSDFFYHRHDDFWTAGAIEKLRILIRATPMLPCAEDLGMIPECMRTVLSRLRILSLEVESMPKYSWGRFSDVSKNPLLSVDTLTTHDMPPLRLWWRENRDAAQDYYNHVLKLEGEAPYDLSPALCRRILKRHLESPSLLCIFAFQDWTAADEHLRADDPENEQVNNPADARHYWRYRMHLCIEDCEPLQFPAER